MLNLNTNWVSEAIKYLHQWQAVIKTNFQAIQTAFNNHLAGIGERHNAQGIDYSGDMAGDNVKSALDNHKNAVAGSRHNAQDISYSGIVAGDNTKAALDNLQGEINNLSFTGSEHDALVTSSLIDEEGEDFGPEGNETYLNGRLLKWEQKQLSHLSEIAEMFINIKSAPFNAKGDGITDDSNPIEAAIEACEMAGGGTIFIPAGNYLVSKQFILPSNVNITGIGSESVIIIDARNWTGEITRFYSLFTTIDVPARPQVGYWRLGTGTLNINNITIQNLTIELNRDGNVLDTTQMGLTEFNVVRFEDAFNCSVKKCRVIDKMTQANHHGYTFVFFIIRSKKCLIEDCYFENTSACFLAECDSCYIRNNEDKGGNSTPIETIGGERVFIINNHIIDHWENTSAIGVNTVKCQVCGNIIDSVNSCGIVLGHDEPSDESQYLVPLRSDETVCSQNVIKNSNSSVAGPHHGIILQNGSNIEIYKNTISDLGKGSAYTSDEKIAIRVLGGGATDRFANILIKNNIITNCTAGVRLSKGDDIAINNNDISDVIIAIYSGISTDSIIEVLKNRLINATRALLFSAGIITIERNHIESITDANNCVACNNGYVRYNNNFHKNVKGSVCNTFKSFDFRDNIFINDSIQLCAFSCNNDFTAGTGDYRNILIQNNHYTNGFTNLVQLYHVNGINTGFYIENVSKELTWTLIWNPSSLADGAGETSPNISVSGAELGDAVIVGAPYDLQGITCSGYVASSGIVKIRLQNETGTSIDLANGTWNVKIIKA